MKNIYLQAFFSRESSILFNYPELAGEIHSNICANILCCDCLCEDPSVLSKWRVTQEQ